MALYASQCKVVTEKIRKEDKLRLELNKLGKLTKEKITMI